MTTLDADAVRAALRRGETVSLSARSACLRALDRVALWWRRRTALEGKEMVVAGNRSGRGGLRRLRWVSVGSGDFG